MKWGWGLLIWICLCALFASRWDWSRVSKPADETDAPDGLDSRIDNSDLRELLAKATIAATGVDQEQT